MRFALFVCLALAACVSPPPSQDRVVRDPAMAVVDLQELVVLTADPPEMLTARAERLGYVLRAIHPLPGLSDTLVVLRIPDGTTIPEAISEIEAAVPGVTAGAHHIYSLQSDAPGDRDYAGAMIGWPPAGCEARLRVGMIDAGVLAGYPGLSDGRIAQRDFTQSTAPPATDHGTRMAELLIGSNRRRGTTLYSANVIDPDLGAGNAAGVVAILRGLDWLTENRVDVVNISLAGPVNKLMNRALGRAASDGMILVAAVGNLGPGQPPQYPAAFPFALAVTAVDREGAIYNRAVQGAHVDIAAPGVDILLAPGGRLTVSSGTSLAAPFVTSVVASDPSLARLDIAALRAELGRRAVDLGAAGRDPVFGAGLLQSPSDC